MYAAAAGGHYEAIRLGSVNRYAQTKNGELPLYGAAAGGHCQIINLLIANGANVDGAIKNGMKPLNTPAAGSHLRAMKILLGWGANLNENSRREEIGDDSKVHWVVGTESALLSVAHGGHHLLAIKFLLHEGPDDNGLHSFEGRDPRVSLYIHRLVPLCLFRPCISQPYNGRTECVFDSQRDLIGGNNAVVYHRSSWIGN